MKLRYRIKIEYWRLRDVIERRRQEKENRRILTKKILEHLSQGKLYYYRPGLFSIKEYVAAFKTLGVKFSVGEDDKGRFIQSLETFTWK